MYGILIDVTKCTACEKCVAACIDANGGNQWTAERDRAITTDGLSAQRVSTVLPVGDGRFARKSCMHCLEPGCVSACLVGGLTKSSQGPVLYDPSKCIGCRYCMLACPFHIPRYQWDQTFPFVVKCDMCVERLSRNEPPACVQACPAGALKFGERATLIEQAREFIRQNPGMYIDHLWGEQEFGGTSVMYLSDVDLTELGWPIHEAAAIPSLTEPLVHKTPLIGLSVAFGLIGLNWIIKRRNELLANSPDQRNAEGRHD